ncbi:MAG: hypothetical protein PVI25_08920 [Gammaproteobacteria bacterium]|jgi:glutamate dehydrogenase/leucine dehydrogenase
MSKDDAELESVAAFMEWVEQRHPGETELHQAVQGVAGNVLDLARDDPGFRRQRVLQRLTEQDRSLYFRVVLADTRAASTSIAAIAFSTATRSAPARPACDRLDRELRDIMSVIFGRVRAEAEIGARLSYCRGADRAGFRRVADALVWLGLARYQRGGHRRAIHIAPTPRVNRERPSHRA